MNKGVGHVVVSWMQVRRVHKRAPVGFCHRRFAVAPTRMNIAGKPAMRRVSRCTWRCKPWPLNRSVPVRQ